MLFNLLLIVVLAIAALLVYASTRPDAFRLERTVVINAPPEKVFNLINDFHQWPQWSPWEHLDPALKRTYEGPEAGPGTVYAWDGNNKVGNGRMEILESQASTKVIIKLDFFKPFEAHNTAEFTLAPNDGGTQVTWAMFGPNNFIAKLMQTFFSMDKMVGGQFEQGLAQMKAAAEK
jgi:uncharacterized protein YndB with AHSA1/START domain